MGKLGQNWLIDYRDTISWRYVQFYISIYSKVIYDQYEKKVHQQNNFNFQFYVSIPNIA